MRNRTILFWVALCACGRLDYDPPGGLEEPDAGSPDSGAIADTGSIPDIGEKDAGPSPDAGPEDSGVPDGVAVLSADPAEIRELVRRDGLSTFVTTIRSTNPGILDTIDFDTLASWFVAELGPSENGARTLSVTVDGTLLTSGTLGSNILVFSTAPNVVGLDIPITVTVMEVVHVGPAQTRCPHEQGGLSVDTCDFISETGLQDANDNAAETPTRIVLHDDAGLPATYNTPITATGPRWIAPAEGVPRENIILTCDNSSPGAIWLRADGSRIENVRIVMDAGCNHAINAFGGTFDGDGDFEEDRFDVTRHHFIDRVEMVALEPEVIGSNSTVQPVQLGSFTTVRNSFMFGFWEARMDFRFTQGVRFIQNTLIIPHDGTGFDLTSSDDALIANNVIVQLSRAADDPLVLTDSQTRGALIAGNVAEMFPAAVGEMGSGSAAVHNLIGEVPIESVLRPYFLADASVTVSASVAPEGFSLDGVEVGSDALPGAYQVRSTLSSPRRQRITVGSGTCGSEPCTIDASEEDELQRAFWSSWPGGTIELYPLAEEYAGLVTVSWPITIRGMGNTPDEVRLGNFSEGREWGDYDVWNHGSIIAVLDGFGGSVVIENLMLRLDADQKQDDFGIYMEGDNDDSTQPGLREIRRVLVEGYGPDSGADHGLYLGTNVLVQDSAVFGRWDSCVRFGPRSGSWNRTPETTSWIVNFSCRLTSDNGNTPDAMFDIAGATDSVLANLALSSDRAIPLLRAQRRSSGDGGTFAVDAPENVVVHSTTAHVVEILESIEASNVTASVFQLDPDTDLFEETSLMLVATSTAIDRGIDPTTLGIPGVTSGVSLDGVDRSGRTVDQGAHEQGN